MIKRTVGQNCLAQDGGSFCQRILLFNVITSLYLLLAWQNWSLRPLLSQVPVHSSPGMLTRWCCRQQFVCVVLPALCSFPIWPECHPLQQHKILEVRHRFLWLSTLLVQRIAPIICLFYALPTFIALFSFIGLQFSSVQFSSSVVSNSLRPHESQHARPPCPSPTPEFTQTHAHRVSDAIQPSHPLSSPSPPAPNPSQHQGLFQWVNSSHQVAKVLELQLQRQTQDWSPLGWTGWISLESKGLSGVFSNTIVQKH